MGAANRQHANMEQYMVKRHKVRQQQALNRVTGLPNPELQGRTLPMTPAQKKAQS